MRLVYLSPVPWASFAQRPHKFVEWFHLTQGSHVLWLDPYPTRFPLLSDLRRLRTQNSQENRSPPTWLKLISPPALPIEPLPFSGWVNVLAWRSALDDIDAFSHQQPTLLAIGKPSVLALIVLKRLSAAVSVYDAMDDFPSFYAGLSRMAMRRRERELIGRVTHVLVSSTALKQRWTNIRPDAQFVPNGLDVGILPAPSIGIPAREKKILGYVGTMGSWFDWEWIIYLAKIRPLDIVRLIGPMFTPSPCSLPLNVEILPPCTHQNALRAMLEFDCGLIPFKKNKLTTSVDPIKYYEYKALGLPIISTAFGEMVFREGEDGIFLSHKIEDVKELIQNALLYRANIETVRQFTARHTWEAHFSAAKII